MRVKRKTITREQLLEYHALTLAEECQLSKLQTGKRKTCGYARLVINRAIAIVEKRIQEAEQAA